MTHRLRAWEFACVLIALPLQVTPQERTPINWSLESLFENARARVSSGLKQPEGWQHVCAGDGPNFYLTRTSLGPAQGITAMESAAVDAVLYNHPLARVVVLLTGSTEGQWQTELFDSYLQDGYCVVLLPMRIDLVLTLLYRAVSPMDEFGLPDMQLQQLLGQVVTTSGGMSFAINTGIMALQVLYGGVSLSMDLLLLNPFDAWLPAPLALEDAAVFLERNLEPGGPVPADVLEAEDFEKSWAPRSHTDRGDGTTTLFTSHLAPRSLPKACPFGKRLLQIGLRTFAERGSPPSLDEAATRMYKEYVRSRSPGALSPAGCEIVLLPGWAMVEPHFADGYRYYGRRGPDGESEDRPHYHSQLFSPRAHKERSDWSLIRSLKLLLPSDLGPPSARNVLPRSVFDLARRMLSLRLSEFSSGPMSFGVANDRDSSAPGRAWRTPTDSLDMLDNSMAEAFGVGQPRQLPREAALPGEVGGFRTFRDVRIVGRSACEGATWGSVHVLLRGNETDGRLRFFCRRAARVEGLGSNDFTSSTLAFTTCSKALASDRSQFSLTASPAVVNAALSLLAFEPLSDLGRAATEVKRLTASQLDAHFGTLDLELLDKSCVAAATETPSAVAQLEALLDDVEEQITVVAHSASRCELLDRLGQSFRVLYSRLPVLVTCECVAGADCDALPMRAHTVINNMIVIDVPFDYGLSRGKKLLVQKVETEFILVLDDDFVRSPLSCLECMLWHMRSRLHSYTLPFDMLGFPILEDERNFGAFRGRLRAASGRLFLEPVSSEASADGCARVEIHPMAFLGRTARLRGFKFQDNLQVGEHEQFFYANKYLGLHAAVCFDSTFPHFRIPMKADYKQRRERMQEKMTKEFTKIGFPSMMYLLQKYDILSGGDHAEFIAQEVPPWHVSDDTCGPRPDPPADFGMFFAAIFSSADVRGLHFRNLLRGAEASAENVWLSKLSEIANVNWAFLLPEGAALTPSVAREEEEFGDIVFLPSRRTAEGRGAEPSAEQLRWVLAFLQRFQFRWLLVTQQDAFVNAGALLGAVSALEQASGSSASKIVLGRWRPMEPSAPSPWLAPEFFALTQDVFHLLASNRVVRWLRTEEFDAEGMGGYGAALNAWLSPLDVMRQELPGIYTGRVSGCPGDAAILHPVEPSEFLLLSDAAMQGSQPCQVIEQMRLSAGSLSAS